MGRHMCREERYRISRPVLTAMRAERKKRIRPGSPIAFTKINSPVRLATHQVHIVTVTSVTLEKEPLPSPLSSLDGVHETGLLSLHYVSFRRYGKPSKTWESRWNILTRFQTIGMRSPITSGNAQREPAPVKSVMRNARISSQRNQLYQKAPKQMRALSLPQNQSNRRVVR